DAGSAGAARSAAAAGPVAADCDPELRLHSSRARRGRGGRPARAARGGAADDGVGRQSDGADKVRDDALARKPVLARGCSLIRASWLATTLARDELHVAVADRVVRAGAKQREQLGDHRRLVLRVALRPRARLHLDEIAVARRVQQPIEVHVELDAAVDEQPTAPVILDDVPGGRAEVLAVDAVR